ncbi:YadA-like family protein [Paraburkholderia hayleyella]|uniref:YadA-like family protein n=1 Tax=Paraburkholderia hayleyella TaxID=2152889 RepID=UPI001291F1A9|nr:YadA-like family protein [Paraburkholderia hayleyella]
MKAGTAALDAVNKVQLDTVNTTLGKAVTAAQSMASAAQTDVNALEGIAAKYDSTAKDKLTLGGADGGTTLSNVKAGTVALDAVNKSQLDMAYSTLNTAVVKAQTQADMTAKYVAIEPSGPAASATGPSSIAIGSGAKSDFSKNTALGEKAAAIGGGFNTALGAEAVAESIGPGGYNTAVGAHAYAKIGSATAIGSYANAEGQYSVALGVDTTATGQYSVALGRGTTATGQSSVALGGGTTATRDRSVSVGSRQIVEVTNGTEANDAVNKGQLDEVNTVAATAQMAADTAQTGLDTLNGVAAKYDSTAKDKLTLGGGADGTTLSNVKAGVAATDAVNKGQLDVVNTVATTAQTGLNTLDGIAAKYDSTAKDKLTLGGGADGTTLTNVKAGGSPMDAVNVTQLSGVTDVLGGGAAVNADGTLKAPSYVVQGTTANNVGTALSSLDTVTTKNTGDIAKNTGDITNLETTVNNINTGATGLVQQDATSKAITVGKGLEGTTVDLTGTAGARQLNGVAAGVAATDAVNKGQLDVVNTVATTAQTGLNTLDGIAAKYDSTAKDKLTLGGGADGTTLSNVKAGVAATDAVNKGQLDVVNTVATTAQTGLNTLDGIAAKYDSTAKDKLTLGGGADGTTLANVAAGVAATDAVNKGQLDVVNTVATTAQTGLSTLDGIAAKYDSTAKDKLTLGGGADGTTLTNVKAGGSSMDAVNVTQLSGVTDALGGGAAVNADGTLKAPSYVVQGTTANNVGTALSSLDTATTKNTGDITNLETTVNNINTGTTGLVQQDATSKAITVGKGLEGTTVDLTGTAGARQLNGVAAGVAATDAVNKGQLDVVNTVATTAQTGLSTLDGIAAKYDSTAKDKLTLGGGADGTTLSNVKAGVAATDAVNKGQLDVVNTVATTAQTGLNTLNGIAAKYDSTAKDKLTLDGGADGTTLANVKAGVAATDAVNKGQLDVVNTVATTAQTGLNTLDGIAAKYDSTAKDKLTLGGGADGTTLTNVKAGGSSMDAVNVTQLSGITDALGGGAAVNADGTLKAPSYVVQGTTANNVGIALSSLDTATTKNTGDITNLETTVNNINTGTTGLVQQDATSKAITVGKGLEGTTVDLTGTAGARQLNGVAAGVAATDAVNKGQLDVVNTVATTAQTGLSTLDGLAAKYDSTAKDKLTLGGDTDGTTLSNVKAGVAATDAVNKGQLDVVNTVATTAQTGLSTLDGIAAKYDSTAKDKLTLGGGADGTTLTNVKAGGSSMDAVNVTQLSGVTDALGGGAAVNADGTLKAPSYVVQGTTANNVGIALSSLDTATTKNTGDITNLETTVNNINTGTTGLVQQDATSKAITVGKGLEGTTVDLTGTAGARQLNGVAAGVAVTDAVNKGQLDVVNTVATTAQTGLSTLDGLAAKYDSTAKDKLTLGGGADGTTLTNVKAGGSPMDAVNVTQLSGVTDALGGGATINADGTLKAPSYIVQGTTANNVGTALSSLDTVTTKNTKDIAKNTGDITNLETAVNNISTGSLGLVEQDPITKAIAVGKTLEGSSVDLTGLKGPRQLRGVAPGAISAASTDGLNGAQLYGMSGSMANALGGGAVVNPDGTITMPSYAIGGTTVSGVGGAISQLDDRLTQNSASITQITNNINNGVIGLVTQDSTSGNILVANGLGGQAVSFAGTDGLRVLSGVANGKNDSDAVTVAQLKAVGLVDPSGQALSAIVYDDLSLGRATLGGVNGTVLANVHDGLLASGSREAVNGGQLYALQQDFQQQYNTLNGRVDSLNTRVENSQIGGGDNGLVKPGRGASSLVVGPTADAGGEKAIAVGANASAAGANSLALGADTSASANNAIALGQGSVADRDSTVSVGAQGKERQITNVAPGSAPTDAANMQQLRGVQGQVSEVARRAYSGVAMAMAMSGTYLPSLAPGKKALGVGIGGYKGYGAVAVNFKALTNTGNISWGGGVSTSGHDVGFNAGAGLMW